MGAIRSDAVVLLDGDGVSWWTSRLREGDPAVVWCGSLKAWAVLQAAGHEVEARWLGPLGPAAWRTMEHRLDHWHRALADIPQIRPHGPVTADLAELLTGDLATPALISLALLPIWTRQLASCSRVTIPVGRHFRPPRFSRLGDLPLLALASTLERAGTSVRLVRELDPPAGDAPLSAGERWEGEAPGAAAWLAIGKLRHPDLPLVALEAAGLEVVLLEPESAPALPELFTDTSRFRCHGRLNHRTFPLAEPPPCPEAGAEASAMEWLACLRQWPPLTAEAKALGAERCRLDALLEREIGRAAPRLVVVPEENSLPLERLVQLVRGHGVPVAVLHHTAEVLPPHTPLRWQRHIGPSDALVVPLRDQRPPSSAPVASVLSLDPVRAHLLDALELEGPHPLPRQPAVGWLHYPLQQQSLLPLADPVAYWNAVETVRADLAAEGLPLRLARKPPLEPKGLGDAVAQGMAVTLECLPLAELLASSTVVIAPGHLGTGHLEAIARGRPVVLVSPVRLNRPSQLLENQAVPLPRLPAQDFLGWWRRHDAAALDRLAKEQAEWLRHQLVTTQSLIGWLRGLGVDHNSRPQRFLGSGLMAQQPLMERVEAMDRLSRRVAALRRSVPGRALDRLRRLGRAR
jgi:hypothetical protein